MHFKHVIVGGAALAMGTTSIVPGQAQTLPRTELSNLEIQLTDQAWGTPGRNVAVSGSPLSIGGRSFEKGLGTHALSQIGIQCGGASRFSAQVGLDDAANERGSVEFSIEADGKLVWTSGAMKRGDAAKAVDIDLTGVRFLSYMLVMLAMTTLTITLIGQMRRLRVELPKFCLAPVPLKKHQCGWTREATPFRRTAVES